MHIRPEQEQDRPAVRQVNESAFERPAEADLVAAVRDQAAPVISLVAQDGDAIIGHILFSPVTLSAHKNLVLMGLAPMAVVPELQHQGVGSALVRAGLEACRNLGAGAVMVLGHPQYYPRFGFSPAVGYGIRSEYSVPDDTFMVLELQPGSLRGVSGVVKYHAAFG